MARITFLAAAVSLVSFLFVCCTFAIVSDSLSTWKDNADKTVHEKSRNDSSNDNAPKELSASSTLFTTSNLKLVYSRKPGCFSDGLAFGIRGSSNSAYELCAWPEGNKTKAGECSEVYVFNSLLLGVFDWSLIDGGRWIVSLREIWNRSDFSLQGRYGNYPCIESWVDMDVCSWSQMTHNNKSKADYPTRWNIMDLFTQYNVDQIYFVGDSTMKRVFDTARIRCEDSSLKSLGKYHHNLNATCRDGKALEYVFSAGADRTDLTLQGISSTQSTVIFNTGHNYINLNESRFQVLAERMKEVILTKKFSGALFLASPAQIPANWDIRSKCDHNNVLVRKTNRIMESAICQFIPCALDLFWKSLSMETFAIDGVHYRQEVYDMMLDEILFRLLGSGRQ